MKSTKTREGSKMYLKRIVVVFLVSFLLFDVISVVLADDFPEIEDLDITPKEIQTKGLIRIRADVSDDIGLAEVYLYVGPWIGNTHKAYNPNWNPPYGAKTHHVDIPYQVPSNYGSDEDIHHVKFCVKDTGGHVTQSKYYRIVITPDQPSDKEKPVLSSSSVTPSSGPPGTTFTLKVRAKDNVGVENVTGRIDLGHGDTEFIYLELYKGDYQSGYWRGEYHSPTSIPEGKYTVDFYAVDNAANSVIDEETYLRIKEEDSTEENHSPELSNAYVEPDEISPGYKGSFEYYVTYEDRDGDRPEVIWVNIGQVSSASRSFEMYEVKVYSSGGTYKALYRAKVSASEFPDELTPGSKHFFYIYCSDGEDSDMTKVTEGPVVTQWAELSVSVSATPSVIDAGGSSTIKVIVKSNGELVSQAEVSLKAEGGWFEDDNHTTQVGGHTSGDGIFTAIWHTDDPSEYTDSCNHLFTAEARLGYKSGSGTATVTVNPLSEEEGKILIIDDDGIQLPKKIWASVSYKVIQAKEINTEITENQNYFERYELIIYSTYSWNNTLEQNAKAKIRKFAQTKPTVVYADADEMVEIPLFDITYYGYDKTIMLGNIPYPSSVKTSYVAWDIDRAKIGENTLFWTKDAIVGALPDGGVGDAILISRDFAEDGVIWGLISVVNTGSQGVFIHSLPVCAATGFAAGGACYVTALAGGAYAITTAAKILKDAVTIEVVTTPTSKLDLRQGTLSYPGIGVDIYNVQYSYDPISGYPLLTPISPGGTIYDNGAFKVETLKDSYFTIDDDFIYGTGLCNYPCGKSQDTVEFTLNEQGFNLKLTENNELKVQDNQERSYVFSNPAPLILNNSGMTGIGFLEGNKTSFTIENSGDIYANEPTTSYQLPQPTEVSVGEKVTISVTIQNTGNETITQLWLGLDIYGPDGTKVENTKTPIADEPPPYGTGAIGLIEFSNQGLGLAPGDSRTFIASYEFDISVTGHKYKEGVYTYGFRAWMYGYPGQDGAIPLDELKEVKLTIGGEREEAPFIRSWLLCEPFIYTTGSEKNAHDYDYIEETTVQPNPGQESNGKTWKRYYSSDDYIDLSRLFSPNEYVVGYAHTYIYSPLTQTVQFRAGSDDAVKIWLNGSLVHENYVFRAAAEDQDIVSITLNSGWNRLLVKVLNGSGPWGFYARFTDKNGNEVKGLQYQLNNPAPVPKDSDNDGTPDDQDQCPYEPGPPENKGCPTSESTGTIKVYVRNMYNDRLEGAAVYLDGKYQGETNRSGYLRIDDVPEGYHIVSASRAGYEDGSAEVHVEAGKSTEVKLNLEGSTGIIKVYVRDDSDNELPGATVYLDGEYQGITDEEGYLRIEHVPEGSYTVSASKSGYKDDSEDVHVHGGKIVRAYLYLKQEEKESGTIKVYVKDDSGNKLPGASVYLDSIYKGKTDNNGYLRIYDVPEGSYTVKASKSGYEDDSKKVRVDAGKTEKVYLTLKKETEAKEPSLTLLTPEVDGLTVTINGVANPGTPGATITRIHWEWGDGSSEDQWLPASHTYRQAGTYTVTVTSYQSDGLSTTMSATVRLEEEVKTGSLEVYVTDTSGSMLSGARVYLDGTYRGETGRGYLRIDDVPEGNHTVVASMPGFKDASANIYVAAGITEQMHLQLEKEVEELQLELWADKGCGSTYKEGEQIILYYRANRDCLIGIAEGTPDGGGTFLERKQVVGGQTYSYSKILKGAGTHEFVIVAEDKSAQCNVYVEGAPQIGSIEVYANLSGADVYLDGTYKGKTDRGGYLRIDDVPEGNHTVVASMPGFKDASTMTS